MQLLNVYKTDDDLIIDTSEGLRVCKLRHNNFVDIESLEALCRSLIGKDVKTTAFKHDIYGDKYFYKINEDISNKESLDELKINLIKKLPLNQKFKNRSSQKIFGPPGTGKTTFLLKKIKEHIDNGVKPENIAFISFTNAAANESKKNVSENFPGLGSIDFPNFSTMHSLATKIGGNKGKDLCLEEHWKAFDDEIFCFTEWTEKNDPFSIVSRFKHPVLDLYSLAIARETSLEEELKLKRALGDFHSTNDIFHMKSSLNSYFSVAINSDEDLLEYSQRYLNRYANFKKREALVDFNDVIINSINNLPDERIPTFEVLVIDEAQDLTNILWSLAKKLINKAGTVLIAGDDDQAIMINFGASAHEFLNIKTTKKDYPLPKSFRVPSQVMDYVNAGVMKFILALPNRKPKEWEAADHAGTLNYMSERNFKDAEGKEFKRYEEYDINDLLIEIINKKEDEWLIMCPSKKTGMDMSKALLELRPPIPHFYRNKPMPSLVEIGASNIRIQSIHTSKGDQADNVAIVVQSIGDMSMLVNDPRLAYVALTRAKSHMLPRVVKKGLLPFMRQSMDYGAIASEYDRMFPSEI